ncbi:MAG: hypothetical protein WA948_07080 [Pontixanthobacter sp.]
MWFPFAAIEQVKDLVADQAIQYVHFCVNIIGQIYSYRDLVWKGNQSGFAVPF